MTTGLGESTTWKTALVFFGAGVFATGLFALGAHVIGAALWAASLAYIGYKAYLD